MFVFFLPDLPACRQTPSCPGRSPLLLPLPPLPMSGETLPKLRGEAARGLRVVWAIPNSSKTNPHHLNRILLVLLKTPARFGGTASSKKPLWDLKAALTARVAGSPSSVQARGRCRPLPPGAGGTSRLPPLICAAGRVFGPPRRTHFCLCSSLPACHGPF